jgi:hypothetical protein
MTGGEVLTKFCNTVREALPDWEVFDYPANDVAHKRADVYLDGGDYGGFVFGGQQVQERVVIRFATLYNGRTPQGIVINTRDTYHELIAARDTAIKAVLAASQTYSNDGVKFFPQNQRYPQGQTPGIAKSEVGDKHHWLAEVSFPLERAL